MSSNKILNINELPEELLLLLFNNYLDFKSKLNSKTVCKLWNQLIEEIFDKTRALVITDGRNDYNLCAFKSMVKSYSFVNMIESSEGLYKKYSLSELCLSDFRSYISFTVNKFPNLSSICLCYESNKDDRILELLLQLLPQFNLINVCLLSLNGVFVLKYFEAELFCKQFPNLNHLRIETRLLCAQEITIRLFFRLLPTLKTFVLDVLEGIHSPRHDEFVVIAKSFMQNIATNNTVKSFIAKTCESKYLHFEVKF
jgi:hypothetical protein